MGLLKRRRIRNKWREVEERFKPLADGEKLREALAVDDENLLLRGLVHVLHHKSLELLEQSGVPEHPAEVAKGFAMASCAVEDAADELLQLVDEARKVRHGKVPETE